MAEDFFGKLAAGLREASERDWRTIARPNQLPPPGDWSIWLLLAGRGFGKTRVLSESVIDRETNGGGRIAIVAATAADVRDVCVEGESGILACAPSWNKPTYEPSKRRLTWKSGTIATLYSADEEDRLRGPQHHFAIVDELAAWRYPATWDMLMLGMRLGKNPRVVVATTPKPTKLIKDLVSREGRDVVITRGSTYENRTNLAPQFLKTIVKRYEGSRLGRQELEGELLTDTPGALWTLQNLEDTRVTEAPAMQRIVVAIDPSGSGGEEADECGVIVAGLGLDGEGYVLSDLSGRLAPPEWARRAIDAFRFHRADRIVAEVNFGGEMVIATIAAVDPTVPTKAITSSRGKVLRAEPISTLFEQGRAHLVGTFPELEDQLTSFTSDYNRSRDGSPDRADALVFALTELMCGQPVGGYFAESALLVKGAAITMPPYATTVCAVAATSVTTADTIGVVIVAMSEHTGHALTILDWTLWPADADLFAVHLPALFQRLDDLSQRVKVDFNWPRLYVEDAGIGAALLQQGTERGLPVLRIDDNLGHALALPADLNDRVQLAGRHLHGGRVKITREAHEKLVERRGVTRNHLLAQYLGFRVDEPLLECELLNALSLATLLALENAWRYPEREDGDLELGAPAPPVPVGPPPKPRLRLSVGRHVINGCVVQLVSEANEDWVDYEIEPGSHVVDDLRVHVHRPGAGVFRVL